VRHDVVVVGGGIVGLATALRLVEREPRLSVAVLEKEPAVAAHQTGHNSGVIHSGIYYKPGSAKGAMCVEGARQLVEFCRRHGIAHEICGKLIVATSGSELPALAELARKGRENGIAGVIELEPSQIREREPHAAGLSALWVPPTGIVDYGAVARKYAELIAGAGGLVRTGTRVTGISTSGSGTRIETTGGAFEARLVVNCAGLHSDRVAALESARPGARIVPFRGDYWRLVPGRSHLVKGIIYPVPDPRFPFLGVHFTRMVGGGVEAGPNAVLAFKREGYTKTAFSLRDTWDTLSYPGFWRLARRYWRTGAAEMSRAFSKAALVRSLRRLVPEIGPDDLEPGGAGVRAQALLPTGTLEDDFHILQRGRALHVLNAPSPAATASLAIGSRIADLAVKALG
jgi:L-2-hydroxyglutarate oxidase